MPLSRRSFLKLGAVSSTLVALEGRFQVLTKALGMELEEGGRSASQNPEEGGQKGKARKSPIPSTCLMCGVTDGILGYVEDGRLVKIEGNPDHPNTRGRLCAKGQAGIQYLYDPFRIKWPMKRIGKRGENKWKRITRDEALDLVAEKIKEILKEGEPGKIALHIGRDRFKDFTKRFVAALGTEHLFNHTSICESSLKVGYETTFGQDIDTSDAANAKYMIFFGDNIFEASYMMNPLTQRVVEGKVDNNAKMVVFDPRLSNTAGRADEWFPVLPGTDAAVILAMCNVIMQEGLADTKFIDEWTNFSSAQLAEHLKRFTPEWAEKISGVAAVDIERIAIEFASSQPGFARAYNGLTNNTNGAMNARCLVLLNIIVGNIDKKGGFCLVKGGKIGKVDPEPPKPKGEFPITEANSEQFPLASHHAYHLVPLHIKEIPYPIKLYILHMYNPLYVNPDQELWREVFSDTSLVEFIVDFSPFWSETATEVADLIIPDCTYLERLLPTTMPPVDNYPYVGIYQPVIEPLYESASIYDYYLEIAKRVGDPVAQYFNFDSVEDYVKIAVEKEWGEGSYEQLKAKGVLVPSEAKPKYKTFAKELKQEDLDKLKAEGAQFPQDDGPIKDKEGKKTLGVMKGGVAYKGFGTPSGRLQVRAEEWEKYGFPALPTYIPVPSLKKLGVGDLILITGKYNVHTQSRTANCAWLMDLMHYNPAWINTKTAEERGIKEGDSIVIETAFGAKKMSCRAHLTEGINPKCVFVST